MKTDEIFKESYRIKDETFEVYRKINDLKAEYLDNQDTCSHEIVFKYADNHPRKMKIDGDYFCPACEKVISCIHENDIQDTVFKNSRIIPLTRLSLCGTPHIHEIMKSEVYYNMDLYYNNDIQEDDLSLKMEETLLDYQSDSLIVINKKNR